MGIGSNDYFIGRQRMGRNKNETTERLVDFVQAYATSYLVCGEDAGERDANPGGTVVEFIEQFVEGLLEEISVEHELSLGLVPDRGNGAGRRAQSAQ